VEESDEEENEEGEDEDDNNQTKNKTKTKTNGIRKKKNPNFKNFKRFKKNPIPHLFFRAQQYAFSPPIPKFGSIENLLRKRFYKVNKRNFRSTGDHHNENKNRVNGKGKTLSNGHISESESESEPESKNEKNSKSKDQRKDKDKNKNKSNKKVDFFKHDFNVESLNFTEAKELFPACMKKIYDVAKTSGSHPHDLGRKVIIKSTDGIFSPKQNLKYADKFLFDGRDEQLKTRMQYYQNGSTSMTASNCKVVMDGTDTEAGYCPFYAKHHSHKQAISECFGDDAIMDIEDLFPQKDENDKSQQQQQQQQQRYKTFKKDISDFTPRQKLKANLLDKYPEFKEEEIIAHNEYCNKNKLKAMRKLLKNFDNSQIKALVKQFPHLKMFVNKSSKR